MKARKKIAASSPHKRRRGEVGPVEPVQRYFELRQRQDPYLKFREIAAELGSSNPGLFYKAFNSGEITRAYSLLAEKLVAELTAAQTASERAEAALGDTAQNMSMELLPAPSVQHTTETAPVVETEPAAPIEASEPPAPEARTLLLSVPANKVENLTKLAIFMGATVLDL